MRASISGLTFLPKNREPEKPKTDLEKDRFLVCRLYKYAYRKTDQLKILSQLYLVSESEIAQFLFECGYEDSLIRAKKFRT